MGSFSLAGRFPRITTDRYALATLALVVEVMEGEYRFMIRDDETRLLIDIQNPHDQAHNTERDLSRQNRTHVCQSLYRPLKRVSAETGVVVT